MKYTMKPTLYSKLVKQFKEIGFKVEEGEWAETVGYKTPTMEYWFDVIQDKGNFRVRTHFYFKNTLNQLHDMQIFTSDIVLEEKNIKRLI